MTRTAPRLAPLAGARAAADARDPARLADEPLLAALAYAVAGWPVLPLHTPAPAGGCSCGRAGCASAGKHPRTRHGFRDASTDPARITGWWRRWPDANVGVRTGELVVLDVDGPEGARALAELETEHGPLPATRRARTGRGRHLYFHAADREVASSVGRLGAGLDLRARGGSVVAPPSRHASGRYYAWTCTVDLAPLPAWLADLASIMRPAVGERAALPPAVAASGGGERARRYLQAAMDAELAEVASATDVRNNALNRAAFRLGQLVGAGLGDPARLADALLDAGLHAGLGEREARATIASGLGAGQRHPRPLPPGARPRG
jgi:hypothetical protein